jgi:sulfatase modifying factor 1
MHFWQIKARSLARSATATISKGAQLALLLCGGEDGFIGTSPVSSFPANGYGLYDMAGNVWQWCSDWYRADSNIEAASKNVCRDPRGPAESFDPDDPYSLKRVVKGGSFLCNPDYCESYRPSARRGTPPDTGSSIQVSGA